MARRRHSVWLRRSPCRRRELEEAIDEWVASNTVADVLEQAALLRVPAAPVSNGQTVLDVDHFKARGFYHPNSGRGVATHAAIPLSRLTRHSAGTASAELG